MSGENSTKRMIYTALLGTIGFLLMLLQIPFPGAPWLKIDFSDVPVLVGGFAFGPWIGLVIVFFKNFLFAVVRGQPGEIIGLPMNTLATAVMVLTSSLIYGQKKTAKHALSALFSGITLSMLVMIPANYFIFPIFTKIFAPNAPILTSSQIMEVIIFAVLPFNAVKNILNGLVTFMVYKRVSCLLKGRSDFNLSSEDAKREIEGSAPKN